MVVVLPYSTSSVSETDWGRFAHIAGEHTGENQGTFTIHHGGEGTMHG